MGLKALWSIWLDCHQADKHPQAPTSLRRNVLGAQRKPSHKFQALVYHIFPPTTAIVNYATGLEKKLSANGQFFVGGEMAVNL